MATPDIGTTISEGYANGFGKLTSIVPALLGPALVVGGLAALNAYVTAELGVDAQDTVKSVLSGSGVPKQSFADKLVLNGLGAAVAILTSVFMTGVLAAVTGALRRERLGGVLDMPSFGGSIGAGIQHAQLLMPKVAILALLSSTGTLVSIINGSLGNVVGFVAAIAAAYLGVRWIYAPVVCGSEEASGDDAYAASESVVDGSWWGTLGVMLVVGIAIGLPILIAGAVVGFTVTVLLGVGFGVVGVIVGALLTWMVVAMGLWLLGAAALESAWSQVAPGGNEPPQEGNLPASSAEPHAGPFT